MIVKLSVIILIVYLKLIHFYSNFDSKNLGLPKSFSSLFLQLLFFNNFSFFIGNCLGCCRTKPTGWSRNVIRNITSNASNTSLIPIIVIINWKWKCSIRCIFKCSSQYDWNLFLRIEISMSNWLTSEWCRQFSLMLGNWEEFRTILMRHGWFWTCIMFFSRMHFVILAYILYKFIVVRKRTLSW